MAEKKVIYGLQLVRLSDRIVLVQHVDPTSTHAVVFMEALQKVSTVPTHTDRIAYEPSAQSSTYKAFIVVNRKKGMAAVAILTASCSNTIGYLACEQSLDLFTKLFPEDISSLSPSDCESESAMKEQLKEIFDQFASTTVIDTRVEKVKAQIETVKNIALENVEAAIHRTEKIESVVEATNNLQMDAESFRSSATTLRRQQWMKEMKTRVTIAAVACFFVLIIYLIFVRS